MRRICVTTLVAIVAAIASTARSYAANTFVGTDGPGFTITMSKTSVRVGTYRITIHDRSTIHNFHRCEQGYERARDRDDDTDGEAEEGDLPLRVRLAPHDRAQHLKVT
jgi:hypothetical protein